MHELSNVLKHNELFWGNSKVTQQHNVIAHAEIIMIATIINFIETVSHVRILKSGTQDSLLRV